MEKQVPHLAVLIDAENAQLAILAELLRGNCEDWYRERKTGLWRLHKSGTVVVARSHACAFHAANSAIPKHDRQDASDCELIIDAMDLCTPKGSMASASSQVTAILPVSPGESGRRESWSTALGSVNAKVVRRRLRQVIYTEILRKPARSRQSG